MSAVLAPTTPPLGLIDNLSIEAYHQGAGISKSGLDNIARSPATYYARHLDPNRPPERERAGQLEGSLAHCALLEPEAFDERYAVRRFDGRTKDGKLEASDYASRGIAMITAEQRAAAMAQAESMRALPSVCEALAGDFITEQSAYAVDSETSMLTRCRPDMVYRVERGAILFDGKTFSSAAPDEFARQVARKRYHVQDAFYREVYAAAADTDILGFVFIAVETEYPFLANALMLDDESIEAGRRAYRRDLNTYAECMASNTWPGYGDDISLISLPRWLTRKDEDE